MEGIMANVSSMDGRFDAEFLSTINRYMDEQVADIPNDPLPMWYVFYALYARYGLRGDDLIAFARCEIEKAIDYGAVPARDVWLKRKDGQERRSDGFVKCEKYGENKNDIIDYLINVWMSLGERREFFLEHATGNGFLTPEEYKMMDTFLWGLRFALPSDLNDYSEVDPDEMIRCQNDIWGI